MNFLPAEIIKSKRNGQSLSEKEIQFFIQSYTKGSLPDYQMSAWLMAVYFKGLNGEETKYLTQAMIDSGVKVEFTSKTIKVDKHSTGGVGDKTSLILGPIVAAAGVPVPMISGRGLGHTGGTLDKLESIPGFKTQLSLELFKKNVDQYHLCFIGQTAEICPADKKIYALRDVTATVESLPLICASIMSKKIAEGIDALVLDVKVGTGAFMKTAEEAEKLARALIEIGQRHQKKVIALLTDMNQPLGRFSGNALEVRECLEIMSGKTFENQSGRDLYEDTRELSLWLSAHMLVLGGKATDVTVGYQKAKEILESGQAFKKFKEICELQGGQWSQVPDPQHNLDISAQENGYLESFETEKIGIAGIFIKAGRAQTSDHIEPAAGIEFHVKIGDPLRKGQKVFTLWGNDPQVFPRAEELLKTAFRISLQKPRKQDLILKTLA